MFEDDLDMNAGEDAFVDECSECGHRQHEEVTEHRKGRCEECGAKISEGS